MITNTTRLYFREIEIRDRDQLFHIYSDKEAMRYRGNKPLDQIEDADRMIDKAIADYARDKECRLAIVEKESGMLIGTFLYIIESITICEIGYSIGKDFWKQGYGQEALNHMLVYLKQKGFSKIKARTHTGNLSSVNILQKAGFSQVLKNELESRLEFEKEL